MKTHLILSATGKKMFKFQNNMKRWLCCCSCSFPLRPQLNFAKPTGNCCLHHASFYLQSTNSPSCCASASVACLSLPPFGAQRRICRRNRALWDTRRVASGDALGRPDSLNATPWESLELCGTVCCSWSTDKLDTNLPVGERCESAQWQKCIDN